MFYNSVASAFKLFLVNQSSFEQPKIVVAKTIQASQSRCKYDEQCIGALGRFDLSNKQESIRTKPHNHKNKVPDINLFRFSHCNTHMMNCSKTSENEDRKICYIVFVLGTISSFF